MPTTPNSALGYIGLGKMGGPMVRRLLAAGYDVFIYGRSKERLQPYIDAGAQFCATPRDVADLASVIITCVTDTAAMEDIIFGEHGLTASMHKNRCLVDMSTIDPVLTRAMAARAFELNRLCWIDAPVSGGTVGAEAGTLAIMAGGRAEDIDVVRPILSHLGQRVTHMGPNGAGQVTKLVNQIIVSVTMGMIAEAAGLAVRSGIDAAKIPEALKGGRADSTIMQQMWARFIAEDYKPTGTVDSILKDVTLLRSFAAAFAAPLPFTNMAGEYYRWLAANGHGDEDLTSMFRFFAKAGKDE